MPQKHRVFCVVTGVISIHEEGQSMKRERRDFLRIGSIAVALLALASRAADTVAQQKPGSLPQVDEKDQQAQALGYKHDATKADKEKFKNYQAGQTCATCQLYQGKPKEEWGGCQIFPGKLVNAKGWCSAYQVKKA